MKYIRGFFAFWYDFIVGDAGEVAVGVLLSLLAVYVLVHVVGSGASTYGVILLPLVIVALLAFSLWRVRGSA
jgi:predicted anti-sigma-YlaC factor YlaD